MIQKKSSCLFIEITIQYILRESILKISKNEKIIAIMPISYILLDVFYILTPYFYETLTLYCDKYDYS